MGTRRFDLSLNIASFFVSFMCDWAVTESRYVLFQEIDVENLRLMRFW